MHRQQLGLLVLVLQLSARGNEPWPDTQKRVRGVKGTGTSNSVSVMETNSAPNRTGGHCAV